MKKTNLLKPILLLCALIVGSSSVWALSGIKLEGFESKTDGGTNYKKTITVASNESDCGIGWEIYYGTVSTSNKIFGTYSAAMRLYSGETNYGYLKTTTPIEGLSKVSFVAKAQSSNGANILIDIQYSIDGESWTNIETAMSLTGTSTNYSVNIPSGGKYFKIAISSTSTLPSKDNVQLTIDDVKFTCSIAGGVFYEGMTNYSTSGSDAKIDTNSSYLDSDIWSSFNNIRAGRKYQVDPDGHILFGSDNNASSMVTKSVNIRGNAILTFRVQRYDSSNNGPMTVSVTGATATGDVSASGDASNNVWVNKTVNITGATGNVVITFATGSSTRLRVDDIQLLQEETPVTISELGWNTFSSPYALDFTSVSTAAAYMVTGASDNTLTLAPVTGTIPANTGLLISGTAAANVNIPTVAGSTTTTTSNKLKPGTDATISGADKYVLVKRNNKAAFASIASQEPTIAKGKAYLDLSGVSARELLFFDNETTGIDEVKSVGLHDGAIYNLNGARVIKPSKGLYIMNGKKVIIK